MALCQKAHYVAAVLIFWNVKILRPLAVFKKHLGTIFRLIIFPADLEALRQPQFLSRFLCFTFYEYKQRGFDP